MIPTDALLNELRIVTTTEVVVKKLMMLLLLLLNPLPVLHSLRAVHVPVQEPMFVPTSAVFLAALSAVLDKQFSLEVRT